MVGLMSGILSLGRELATLNHKKITNAKFWACVRIAFVLAAASLWYTEHQRANQLATDLSVERDRDTPNLTGKIDEIISGYTPELNAISLFMMASVRNIGAPTVVEGWSLDIEYGGAKFLPIQAFIPDGYRLFDEGHRVVATFRRQDALYEKTASPVPTGGLERGWLRYIVKGLRDEDRHKSGIKYTLHFSDVRGKAYTAVQISTGQKSPPQYLPGAEQPFKIPIGPNGPTQ